MFNMFVVVVALARLVSHIVNFLLIDS